MTLRARGELAGPTDTIVLTAQFYNSFGLPANLISYPQISIVSPSGLNMLNFTSSGVQQLDVGKYSYNFVVPYDGPYGVFNDLWKGSYDNISFEIQTLSFIVSSTQLPAIINSDGYTKLGDDPGYNYSQTATKNVNKILKILKARLNSSGLAKSNDSYGNIIYINCDVFSNDLLISFISNSITNFNQIPYLTFFTFDDTWFVDQFLDILVEGATLMALASQALIERGREFQITDNGVNFTPPTESELLQTQYSTLITVYTDKLKYIKNSLRPQPLGLGVFNMNNSTLNPAIRALNHLRARRLF